MSWTKLGTACGPGPLPMWHWAVAAELWRQARLVRLPRGLWQNHISLPRWSWRPRCPLPPTSYGLRPHAPHRKLLTWLLKVTTCCPYRMIPLGDRGPSEWLPRQCPSAAVPENRAFLTHGGSQTAGLALWDPVCCWLSHQFAHQRPHWLIGSHSGPGAGWGPNMTKHRHLS